MADQVLYPGRRRHHVADHDARADQPRLRRREVGHDGRRLGADGHRASARARTVPRRRRRPRSARPLLESSIEGAKGVLLSIAGPTDLTLHEVNQAAEPSPRSRTRTPTSSSAPWSTTRWATRSASRSSPPGFDKVTPAGRRLATSSRAACRGCSRSRSAARAEREPLPSILLDDDDDDVFTTASPSPRRSRSTPRRTWTSPTSSRASGSRSRSARPRARWGGEIRARRRPSPASWPSLPAPFARSGRRHAAAMHGDACDADALAEASRRSGGIAAACDASRPGPRRDDPLVAAAKTRARRDGPSGGREAGRHRDRRELRPGAAGACTTRIAGRPLALHRDPAGEHGPPRRRPRRRGGDRRRGSRPRSGSRARAARPAGSSTC